MKGVDEVRTLRDGDWYWIDKAVIQRYTPLVGAMGIAVYSFLASLADRNQRCFPSQKYIAEHLGYSRTTVNRALKGLEKTGLIRIVKRDRYHCVYSLLAVRCASRKTQMSTLGNPDVGQRHTNDNKLTRINNNDIGIKHISDLNPFRGSTPTTREELLAWDLAKELNDLKGLPFYLSYAKKYPEFLLRRILGEVKEMPANEIRKSRGAVFNYLIQKYEKRRKDHSIRN